MTTTATRSNACHTPVSVMSHSLRIPLDRAGIAAAVSGAVYFVLLLLDKTNVVQDIDGMVVLAMRELRHPWLDVVGAVDARLTHVLPTFAVALAMALVLARAGPPWAWIAPPFILLTGVIELGSKQPLNYLIHPVELLRAAQELIGIHYYAAGSFPSGHVARAVFLAVVALGTLPRGLGVAFAAGAAVTFGARMYVEVHRLTEVLGGVALGLFVGFVALWTVSALGRDGLRAGPKRVHDSPMS